MPRMKVVWFEQKRSDWYKWVMKAVTGCPKQHVGFLCPETGVLYDMSLQRRHRTFSNVIATHEDILFTLIDSPVDIPEKYLMDKEINSDHYGAVDYVFFLLRPLYHLIGKTTRNQDGIICSEQVYTDMVQNGWAYSFREVPSPCNLFNAIIEYYVKTDTDYNLTLIEGGTGKVIKA